MNLVQRIRDWQHERRIRRLSRRCYEAYSSGDKAMAYLFDELRMTAICKRSPAQIRRMERRLGMR